MNRHNAETRHFRMLTSIGYLLIALLVGGIMYTWLGEWRDMEGLEAKNREIDEFRKEVNNIHIHLIEFSLLGETILEWDDEDLGLYHARRMTMDSMLCRFKAIYPVERIDSVRHFLEDKERQMCQIVQILEQQQAINDKITSQVPIIVQKSVQEQPKKSKRKGFLGIFGKKEEAKPTATTTMLRSLNRNMIAEQQAQSRRLSEHADSLATRNAELNRQLQGLVVQMDEKVQADIQKREAEITAMREQSFIQIGGLTGFVVLLLVISYIIIHRNITRIKRYKRETADLIEQQIQSIKQNEALIASRKKAVHTITHELRSPLTAITGYAGLMRKDCNTDKTGTYIRNIQESSDRMREMLNTLLNFFRLDNGKEQPNFSPCRISAITHILETEFTPIAMNKGLALTITNQTDTVVLTDKERILQIGNNLLSNAIKFTENGGVSLTTDYDNGVLKLIVKDTGTGMTEEERAWLDAIPIGASANNAYELKLLRIQQRHIMEKIAEYEKCNPEELFTATITDMRKPGPDAEGKTADSAVQKMAMVNKDSAFVRVTQLREALNKVSGRIISLTTQIRQQEEFEKRYALELAHLDIAKMRATGEVDIDPEGDEEDEEEAPHDKDSGAVS